MKASSQKYMTVREAASRLGISTQRVHQLVKSGKLDYKQSSLYGMAVKFIETRSVERRLLEQGK